MADGGAGNAPSQAPSRLSFTEGFLLGQLSIVILIGAFIKFFIFGDPPSPDTIAAKRAHAYSNRIIDRQHWSPSIDSPSSTPLKLRNKRSASHNVLRTPSRLTTATILAKTYYNVNSHQPESLDWFNVLIAQTIAQFRNDAHHDDAILTSLTEILNGPHKPDILSTIKVTEISLGEDFPILSNCRVHPVDDESGQGGRLQARMDVDLSDFITLGVETKIILNYPKPLTAVLPVALAVSVIRFSGTLSISFVPSSVHPTSHTTASTPPQAPGSASGSGSRTPTTLAFSFLPDYRLDLSVRSLVGSRSRLQDIPKIAQLVESRLHAWIDERCVEPRVQQVVLPSLWPRMRNTRGPMGAEGDEEDAEGEGEGEEEGRGGNTMTRAEEGAEEEGIKEGSEPSKILQDESVLNEKLQRRKAAKQNSTPTTTTTTTYESLRRRLQTQNQAQAQAQAQDRRTYDIPGGYAGK